MRDASIAYVSNHTCAKHKHFSAEEREAALKELVHRLQVDDPTEDEVDFLFSCIADSELRVEDETEAQQPGKLLHLRRRKPLPTSRQRSA